MKRIKVTIIGNSVALRVRPTQAWPNNKNYTLLLEECLQKKFPDVFFQVNNKSKGASTILDKNREVDDFVSELADVYVLNLGVVDACTREIPRWFSVMLAEGKRGVLMNALRWINARIIKKNRPFFVKLRGQKPWVKQKVFKKFFAKFVDTLLKDSNAKIIALPINLADSRVEKQLPGSIKNQQKYNKIITEVIESRQQKMIELSDITHAEHYPDGVHYSEIGHKVVAERLFTEITKILEDGRLSDK